MQFIGVFGMTILIRLLGVKAWNSHDVHVHVHYTVVVVVYYLYERFLNKELQLYLFLLD